MCDATGSAADAAAAAPRPAPGAAVDPIRLEPVEEVTRLAALVGGFHLGGPAFEPVIPPTVEALTAWAPHLVVPGHCTGWRAQHALAATLPDAWRAGSSGSAYTIAAA